VFHQTTPCITWFWCCHVWHSWWRLTPRNLPGLSLWQKDKVQNTPASFTLKFADQGGLRHIMPNTYVETPAAHTIGIWSLPPLTLSHWPLELKTTTPTNMRTLSNIWKMPFNPLL